MEGVHEFVLFKEPEAAVEVYDLGVGVDDVLQAVSFGGWVWFGVAQCLVEQACVLA